MNTLNDNELLLLVKDNNETAFSVLFNRYWKRLLLEALNTLSDEAEAGDTVQEVFIWFWQKRGTVVVNNTLRAYLLQAVRNKCLDRIRKRSTIEKRQRQYAYIKETVTTPVPIENMELGIQLNNAISEIGSMSRTAFEMMYIDRKSQKETALEMGISTLTVKTHVRNALRKLRKKLENIK